MTRRRSAQLLKAGSWRWEYSWPRMIDPAGIEHPGWPTSVPGRRAVVAARAAATRRRNRARQGKAHR